MLTAKLNRQNYRDEGGKNEWLFVLPTDLLEEAQQFREANRPKLAALTLPTKCREYLAQSDQLEEDQLTELAAYLQFRTVKDSPDREILEVARVAAASTLLALGSDWLRERQEIASDATTVVENNPVYDRKQI